ncbi:phage protein NinX family protein [Serratia fonticola]|uniref:phage protein NinX family protein n=1 Tax=Serratia fonticola TaxID=47917 RepID=UPI003AAFB24B
MTNYNELSDLEINKRVASYQGLGQVFLARNGDRDYCNNADHAWPIIVNNKISLLWNCGSWSSWAGEFPDIEVSHDNPLRAAAIVYLMMQEQQHDR